MYHILYGFLYFISLLPFFILYGISDFFAFILYNIAGYRKKVVLQNLDIAFPEKTIKEKKRIARQFYRNLTDTFIESIKLLSLSDKEILRRATINFDEIRQLEEEGRNIQYHSGHQMNWEYGNYAIAMRDSIPFVGVYMRINNKALDKLFYNLRSKKGTVLVAAQEFKNRVHQLFQSQYSLGLAADQNPGVPSSAYWLNFFNRPAPFVTGPDKGARKNSTAVVFVKFIKKKRGFYHFETSVIARDGSQLKDGELTVLYRDFLEETIRQQPDNYLWSHRRWKWGWDPSYKNRWIDRAPAPMD
jgi:Kdo2-lipid IVA lauroyltransferase/acyltransferase